ncbi:MAG: T9SS C-terminal target domain-containing protein, partial [Candidatus Neomarinimicrobiota bacterium]
SVGGAENLSVEIGPDHVVTVAPVQPDWVGSETLGFTVTDVTANGFSSTDSVTFTILPVDHPPVLSAIPDQVIGSGGMFASLELNTYVTEIDGDSLAFGRRFLTPAQTDTNPRWVVQPSAYVSSMTITARVTARGAAVVSPGAELAALQGTEVRGVVSPVEVLGEWLFFLTVYGNTDGDTLRLRLYEDQASLNLPTTAEVVFAANTSLGTPEAPLEVTAGYLAVDISDGIGTVSVIDPGWSGTETVEFEVQDVNTLHGYGDSTAAGFTILPDHTPVVSGLEDQTVEAGQAFAPFDLDGYVTELDGDSVTWSVGGAENLSVEIGPDHVVTVAPVQPDWVGSETLGFTVTDVTANGFSSTDSVTFTILPVDHPPVLSAIPDDTIGIGGEFQDINLREYLTELDSQEVAWTYFYPVSDSTGPEPGWSVDPNGFEFNMNLTSTVELRETPVDTEAVLLGVFAGDECRGLATPEFVLNRWIFFLTIYGNVNGETLRFRVWDARRGDMVSGIDTVVFQSDDILGSPESPYEIRANRLTIDIDPDQMARPRWVSADPSGSETVALVVQDVGTNRAYSDTAEVTFTVLPVIAPVVLPLTPVEILEGETLPDIHLNEYLDYSDPVHWSVTGNEAISVTISGDSVAGFELPDSNWNGVETLRFTATAVANDQLSGWSDLTITVLPVNDLPVFTSQPVLVTGEDQLYTYHLEAEDVDGDSLIFSAITIPDWLELSGDGILSGVPVNDDVGSYPVQLSVTDPVGPPQIQAFTLTVTNRNDPPVLVIPFSDVSAPAGQEEYLIDPYLEAHFMDVDPGDHLEFSARIPEPGGDSLRIEHPRPDSTLLFFIPEPDFAGMLPLIIRATDDSLARVEDTLVVELIQSNRPPVFTSEPETVVDEDQPYTYVLQGRDPDGNALTFGVSVLPDWLEFQDDSILTGTPGNEDVGDHPVAVWLSDGIAEPVHQEFIIRVVNVNDAPVAVAGEDQITLERMTFSLDGTASFDEDRDSLRFTWLIPEELSPVNLTAARPGITTPDVTRTTRFPVVLIVSDSLVASVPDSQWITVTATQELDITDYQDTPVSPGGDLPVSITFPEYFPAVTATLRYLTGGESIFHEIMMSTVNRSRAFQAAIPGAAVAVNGVVYSISAVDTAGRSMETDRMSVPVTVASEAVSMSQSGSAYPAGLSRKTWRIFSVPTRMQDASLATRIQSPLGTGPGDHTWQVYGWEGSDWVRPDSLQPGVGYWIQQRVENAIVLTAGPGRSIDLTGFDLTLRPGWNLVSSPYSFPVEIEVDGNRFSGPFPYGATEGEGWSGVRSRLQPWGGYAMYSWVDSVTTLHLDPLFSADTAFRTDPTASGWKLNLGVSGDGLSDGANWIGESPTADEGRDSEDQIEPPVLDRFVRLALRNETLDSRQTLYSGDIRSPGEGIRRWDVEIKTDVLQGSYEVHTALSGALPAGESLLWIDPNRRETVSLSRGHQPITVRLTPGITYPYRILAGETAAVLAAADDWLSTLPEAVTLDQNFPNPFNGRTMISYAIPVPSGVRLELFDLRGRRVQTLVSQVQTAGQYSVVWDGKNRSGHAVSSGVYFYRILVTPVDGKTAILRSKKMVYLR